MEFHEASREIGRVFDEYLPSTRKSFVPGETVVQYAGNVYGVEEYKAASEVLLKGWLGLSGSGIKLEAALSRVLGTAGGVLTNSGSSANLLAVAAMKSSNFRRPLKAGDEVINPASGFPTTLNPIIQNGLVPVFVDVDLGNYNLLLDRLEDCVSPRTRALFFAHTLGNPADMAAVSEFCARHDLLLLEDCCDALGASFMDRPVGSFGDFATVSMYPSHHITMGEGGFVGSKVDSDAVLLRSLRDWGRACYCVGKAALLEKGTCGDRFSKWLDGLDEIADHRYVYSEIGYNLRPIELQAAMGLIQMGRLPGFIQARHKNFRRYYEFFKKYEEFFILPTWDRRAVPSWFAFPLTIRLGAPFEKSQFVQHLESRKVQTRSLFAGNILRHPAYRGIPHRVVGALENCDRIISSAFFIGIYPGITEEMSDYVCSISAEFLDKFRDGGRSRMDECARSAQGA